MSNDEFPAFSVLMSVYKKEKPAFLDKALESIEDQTVKTKSNCGCCGCPHRE